MPGESLRLIIPLTLPFRPFVLSEKVTEKKSGGEQSTTMEEAELSHGLHNTPKYLEAVLGITTSSFYCFSFCLSD